MKKNGAMDQLGVATALSAALKDKGFSLIFTGFKTVDDDSSDLGPMIATLLDIPCITEVHSLDVSDGSLKAARDVEGGSETVEASLPCVVTAQKGLNEPRYPNLKGIMMAKKKPIEEVEAEHTDSRVEMLGFEYPPERAAGKIVGEGVDAVPELVRLLREEARVIE